MMYIYLALFYFSTNYNAIVSSLDYSGCGIPSIENDIQIKIIGGTDTSQRNWPWNVQLVYEKNPGEYYLYCGGALIDKHWIVTAAHCLFDLHSKRIKDLRNAYVILGDSEVSNGSSYRYLPRQLILVHKSYDGVGKNDIALIRLSKPVQYTEFIRPVCLSEYKQDVVGKEATITGWGTLSPNGQGKPIHLQMARVEVFSSWECAVKFAAKLCFWCAYVMAQDTICAGRTEGGVDSCQGDSGSSLVVKGAGAGGWTLVGVVSGGVACGDKWTPSLYTYVPNYTLWIHKNMKEHSQ